VRHNVFRARPALGPDLTFTLLVATTITTIGVSAWLGWRLLLTFWQEQGEQNSVDELIKKCLLLLGSPYLADRLLAYMLVGSLLAAISFGGWTLFSQLKRTRDTVRRLQLLRRHLPAAVADSVANTGLDGKVVLIETGQPIAFCYGLLTGRILISTALIEAVGSGRSLEAILWHEFYHLQRRDSLRMALGGALVRVCFFLPIAKDLYQHYLVARELAADRAAIAAMGGCQPLAAALYRLAAVTAPQPQVTPTFAANAFDTRAPGTLNARFDAILGESNPYHLHISLRRLFASLAVITVSTMFLTISYAAPDGLLATICQWLQSYCLFQFQPLASSR
jgi:Zn-dependent protease with chaperone function